jgi:hypothetical protein
MKIDLTRHVGLDYENAISQPGFMPGKYRQPLHRELGSQFSHITGILNPVIARLLSFPSKR